MKQDRSPKIFRILLLLLLLSVILLFVSYHIRREDHGTSREAAVTQQKDTLDIYYPTDALHLAKKTIETKKTSSSKEKANVILRSLQQSGCIPPNTSLIEIAFDTEGTIYVDLSKDITIGFPSGMKDISATYALINSLITNFKDGKKVQILIEGKPAYTLGGIVYTYLPVSFNKDFLEG